MTIKLKLQLLILATLLSIGGGIVAVIIGFNTVHGAYQDSERRAKETRGLYEIKSSALSTIQLDPTANETKILFADARKNIAAWGDTVMPMLRLPEQKQQLRQLLDQWNAYDQKSQQIFDLATHDAPTATAQVAALYQSDFLPMHATIDQMVSQIDQLSAASASHTESMITMSRIIVMVILLAVMAVVVGWTAILSRQILRSLSNIQGALQQASASLDLGVRARVERRDEIGLTADAFNHLMTRVSEVMRTVQAAVESVHTASAEIAAGNIDLSTRTEEQAAALEETAASMEELTGTVGHNAENARQASTLATSASATANRGNEVVSQAVDTMREISSSSARIADITGMIEGIAFQTNILALNAAVEAARAGEQGRGFAVVAGEVRSLAQRAASAAKEIKELIDISVTTSARGSDLVNRTGATMSEIIGAVARVNDIMAEIAAASGEQSRGIDQVGTAVTQMDRMTQQNAALVEQAAAAAQSMQDQASRLKQAVETFRFAA